MMSEFQFVDFLINNIDYKAMSLEESDEKGNNELEFAYSLNHEENIYTLGMLVIAENVQSDHKLKIRIETKGKFIFLDDSTLEEEKRDAFIKSNGSAIIFPYIRSLLYNLTSADSHGDAIILPTINFSKVIEDIDKNLEIEKNEEPTPIE